MLQSSNLIVYILITILASTILVVLAKHIQNWAKNKAKEINKSRISAHKYYKVNNDKVN